jgi:hypothetical protein
MLVHLLRLQGRISWGAVAAACGNGFGLADLLRLQSFMELLYQGGKGD